MFIEGVVIVSIGAERRFDYTSFIEAKRRLLSYGKSAHRLDDQAKRRRIKLLLIFLAPKVIHLSKRMGAHGFKLIP